MIQIMCDMSTDGIQCCVYEVYNIVEIIYYIRYFLST